MRRVWRERVLGWVVLGTLFVPLSGCGISRDQYLRLENEKKELEFRVNDLTRQIQRLTGENEELAQWNQSLQQENRRLQVERERPQQEALEEPETDLK